MSAEDTPYADPLEALDASPAMSASLIMASNVGKVPPFMKDAVGVGAAECVSAGGVASLLACAAGDVATGSPCCDVPCRLRPDCGVCSSLVGPLEPVEAGRSGIGCILAFFDGGLLEAEEELDSDVE